MGEGKIFGDKGEGNIREPLKGFYGGKRLGRNSREKIWERYGREPGGRSRGKRGEMRGSLEREPKGKREGREARGKREGPQYEKRP